MPAPGEVALEAHGIMMVIGSLVILPAVVLMPRHFALITAARWSTLASRDTSLPVPSGWIPELEC